MQDLKTKQNHSTEQSSWLPFKRLKPSDSGQERWPEGKSPSDAVTRTEVQNPRTHVKSRENTCVRVFMEKAP